MISCLVRSYQQSKIRFSTKDYTLEPLLDLVVGLDRSVPEAPVTGRYDSTGEAGNTLLHILAHCW